MDYHQPTGVSNTNTAEFRFYEELNNYLPPIRRNRDLLYAFSGNPALEEILHTLGIPTGGINLVLANGISVGFDYCLNGGDRIAVYPTFESLDISLLTELHEGALRKSTFVANQHLGRLAKMLRMLGFDTAYSNSFHDQGLLQLSADEKRLILTRGGALCRRKDVTRLFLVRSEHPREQLAEVLNALDLFSQINPFSRCISCNGLLKPVPKESIESLLPARIRDTFNDFNECSGCLRLYWKGTHYTQMEKQIERIKESSKPNSLKTCPGTTVG